MAKRRVPERNQQRTCACTARRRAHGNDHVVIMDPLLEQKRVGWFVGPRAAYLCRLGWNLPCCTADFSQWSVASPALVYEIDPSVDLVRQGHHISPASNHTTCSLICATGCPNASLVRTSHPCPSFTGFGKAFSKSKRTARNVALTYSHRQSRLPQTATTALDASVVGGHLGPYHTHELPGVGPRTPQVTPSRGTKVTRPLCHQTCGKRVAPLLGLATTAQFIALCGSSLVPPSIAEQPRTICTTQPRVEPLDVQEQLFTHTDRLQPQTSHSHAATSLWELHVMGSSSGKGPLLTMQGSKPLDEKPTNVKT